MPSTQTYLNSTFVNPQRNVILHSFSTARSAPHEVLRDATDSHSDAQGIENPSPFGNTSFAPDPEGINLNTYSWTRSESTTSEAVYGQVVYNGDNNSNQIVQLSPQFPIIGMDECTRDHMPNHGYVVSSGVEPVKYTYMICIFICAIGAILFDCFEKLKGALKTKFRRHLMRTVTQEGRKINPSASPVDDRVLLRRTEKNDLSNGHIIERNVRGPHREIESTGNKGNLTLDHSVMTVSKPRSKNNFMDARVGGDESPARKYTSLENQLARFLTELTKHRARSINPQMRAMVHAYLPGSLRNEEYLKWILGNEIPRNQLLKLLIEPVPQKLLRSSSTLPSA